MNFNNPKTLSERLERTLQVLREELNPPVLPTKSRPSTPSLTERKFTEHDLKAYMTYICSDYDKSFPSELMQSSRMRVEIEKGRKFFKVLTNIGGSRSAHSFIDADGNIWKSASWKAPALNFIRGNIITRDFTRIRWTGAL